MWSCLGGRGGAPRPGLTSADQLPPCGLGCARSPGATSGWGVEAATRGTVPGSFLRTECAIHGAWRCWHTPIIELRVGCRTACRCRHDAAREWPRPWTPTSTISSSYPGQPGMSWTVNGEPVNGHRIWRNSSYRWAARLTRPNESAVPRTTGHRERSLSCATGDRHPPSRRSVAHACEAGPSHIGVEIVARARETVKRPLPGVRSSDPLRFSGVLDPPHRNAASRRERASR